MASGMWDFTGRKRHRVHQRFGRSPLCVLQLEVHVTNVQNMGSSVEVGTHTEWIDALPEHLTIEENDRNESSITTAQKHP